MHFEYFVLAPYQLFLKSSPPSNFEHYLPFEQWTHTMLLISMLGSGLVYGTHLCYKHFPPLYLLFISISNEGNNQMYGCTLIPSLQLKKDCNFPALCFPSKFLKYSFQIYHGEGFCFAKAKCFAHPLAKLPDY